MATPGTDRHKAEWLSKIDPTKPFFVVLWNAAMRAHPFNAETPEAAKLLALAHWKERGATLEALEVRNKDESLQLHEAIMSGTLPRPRVTVVKVTVEDASTPIPVTRH